MTIGRGFSADDDLLGAGLVAVISDGYWSRRFGCDPQVLGRPLTIDGRPTVVIGVTAAGFSGLDPGAAPEITLPMAVRALDAPDFLTSHETWYGDMPIVARLAPGVSAAQAGAVVDAVLQQYPIRAREHLVVCQPEWRARARPAAARRPGHQRASRSVRAVAADPHGNGVSGPVRGLRERRQPVAGARPGADEGICRLPAPIGAGRMRLARQLLTESLVLALLGGGLGLLVALFCTRSIAALLETGATPILLDLQPNAIVLLFTLTIAILTGLLFGLAPAIGCTRVDPAPALKSISAAVPRSRRWSTRQVLVAAQIGLCVLLVSGAGLLVRTLRNLETRNSGFDCRQLLLFSLDARRTPFPITEVPALCDALAERLVQRGAGLSAACARNIVMSSRGNARPLDVPGAPPQPPNARIVFTNMVTPDYFRTLGIGVAARRASIPRLGRRRAGRGRQPVAGPVLLWQREPGRPLGPLPPGRRAPHEDRGRGRRRNAAGAYAKAP